ncbi:MAG: Ig-like domain-containing protein [Dehalococcoidia bacterium]
MIKNSGGSYEIWYSQLNSSLLSQLDTLLSAISGHTLPISDLFDIAQATQTVVKHATSTNGTTWSNVAPVTGFSGVGIHSSVVSPEVVKTGSSYEMWYQTGRTNILDAAGLSTLVTAILALQSYATTAMADPLAFLFGHDFDNLLTAVAGISGLAHSNTYIGYATSTDGTTWAAATAPALGGSSDAIWSSVGLPSVVKDDAGYEMWFTKGISDITNSTAIMGLLLGETLPIGHATVTQSTYTLTTNLVGTGTITRNNAGPYHYGDVVQLTANAATSWTFDAWSGDATGTASPVNITMDGNKTVTATFTQNTYTLTTNVVGNGTITRNNTGPYHSGDVVQLTANAATSWTFSGWSGDAAGTTSPVSVTINGNKAVTATFTQNTYTLTTNVVGTGTITLNNAGPYYTGDIVQLTANPGAGYRFSAWSGGAAGANTSVNVIMSSNKTATATFVAATYQVTFVLGAHGTRTGGGALVQTVLHGAAATAPTFSVEAGWTFTGWSTTFNNVTADLTVTAQYVQGRSGGPDAYGYTYKDTGTDSSGVPYNWVDISGTGTAVLPSADDAVSATLSLGFNFDYYGTVYSQVAVSTNALAFFGATSTQYANQQIMNSWSAHGFVSPFWDDLITDASGQIFYQTLGSAPNRTFVVQWNDIKHYGSSGRASFQAILYETSNNIKFQYKDVTFGDYNDAGASATVGIESPAGNDGLQYSYNEAALRADFAILFEYPHWTGVNLTLSKTATETKDAGDAMGYTLNYRNIGDAVAHGVVLTDTLPANVTFLGASGGGTHNAGTVTWNLGDLASLGTGSVTVEVRVNAGTATGTILVNNANITTTDTDVQPANNSAQDSTRVTNTPLPPDVGIGGGVNNPGSTSTPNVYWGTPTIFTYYSDCATAVNISIDVQYGLDIVNQPMTGTPSGLGNQWTYSVTFYSNTPGQPMHGNTTVTYNVIGCASPASFPIYIDPAGIIYDAQTNNTITGADVTLDRWDGSSWGVAVSTTHFDPEGGAITNPDTTDANGRYHWNTVAGDYRVRVAMPPVYAPATSREVSVPPEVFDLHVWLNPIYAITPSVGANGSILPAVATSVNYGSNQSFTITANANYHIADVLVDSDTSDLISAVSVGAVNSYGFVNVGTNCSISASFAINTYTINASAGANGSVSPTGATTVNHGSNQTFTVTPNAGYHIADVVVGGGVGSVGAVGTYTFTSVTAANTITATFAIDTYTITASVTGGNGTATAGSPTANHGGTATITITPIAGYHIASITDNGSAVSATTATTYVITNVVATHAVVVTFAINTYAINASAGANGSIAPSGVATVNHGSDSAAYAITANAGYFISDLVVDGGSVGALATYTFASVTTNHTISAAFAAVGHHTITATAGANGSITPSGAVDILDGGSQSFTIAANANYHISDVKVDGVSQGPITTYPFSNVTASHTISATFAINTYNITSSAGANGSISPTGVTAVNYGSSQAYTIAANGGYYITDVLVDTVSVGAVGTYNFTNVTAAHTISASFATTYTITASAGSGGSIAPSGAVTVNPGGSQTFAITANSGYHIGGVLVDGSSVGAVSSYTFTNVTSNHTISASFAADAVVTPTTTPPPSGDGTTTPVTPPVTPPTPPVTPPAPPSSSGDVSLAGVAQTVNGVTTANVPAVGANYTAQDPAVGQVEATVSIQMAGTVPTGASVQVSTSLQPSAAAGSAFQLAAANASLEIVDVAYVINVTKTNLQNVTDVASAAITMKVGAAWVAAHGGTGAIKIVRFDPDTGAQQVLETVFKGYDAQGRAIFEGISPDGLSVFGLVAVKAAPPAPVVKYNLTAMVDPAGSGMVSLVPAQPAGGYDAGTVVTLTASANTGYNFDRWSGDASGIAKIVTVTMDSDKSVTAHFSAVVPPVVKYTLTTAVDLVGSGAVAIHPAQPSGGYDAGTVVTLTATANAGYTFGQWSGDASGVSKTITVTMNSDKSVTAHFVAVVTPTDVVPPTVNSILPENGTKDVSRDTKISITFSEAMDKASVEQSFSIVPKIGGTLSWSGNTVVFTPEKKLKWDTTYTVTVSTAAKDVAGNAMSASYVSSMTTESESTNWWPIAIAIAAALAVLAVAILLILRRRKVPAA